MKSNRPLLGQTLLNAGVINEGQLATALSYHRRHRCRLGEALIMLEFCTEVDVTRVLAEQMEMPFVDLDATPPEPRTVSLIPRRTAQELGVIPVRHDGTRLTVVARNPFDYRVDDALRKAAGMSVVVACGVDAQILKALRHYDELKTWRVPAEHGPIAIPDGKDGLGARLQERAALHELSRSAECPELGSRLVSLLQEAARRGASEITFDSGLGGIVVRARIQGSQAQLDQLPAAHSQAALMRLKTLCGIAAEGEVREGAFELRIDGTPVCYQATLESSADGELLALRSGGKEGARTNLARLDFTPHLQEAILRALQAPAGLFLVAGPAGSSVAATLDALGEVVQSDWLRETLTGFNDLWAAVADDAAARPQEPLVLTKIEDAAAMVEACRAVESGRLVLAAVQAPHAVAALRQFESAGVPRDVMLKGVLGALTQRCARRVCEACAVSYAPEPELLAEWGQDLLFVVEARFRRGRGCPQCGDRGTRGRLGVHELILGPDLRALFADADAGRIRRTLRDDAAWKAHAGLIPADEIGFLASAVVNPFCL